jgi:hypothetical protein
MSETRGNRVAEQVELHGGPRHGQVSNLPFPSATKMEVEVIFRVDGTHLRRRGFYTRVHDILGKAQPHFEWNGYTTAFMPMEADAQ